MSALPGPVSQATGAEAGPGRNVTLATPPMLITSVGPPRPAARTRAPW